MTDQAADKPVRKDERACTTHSVVRFRVTRASPKCPVFRKGDEFFVRQHVLDTEVSTVRIRKDNSLMVTAIVLGVLVVAGLIIPLIAFSIH